MGGGLRYDCRIQFQRFALVDDGFSDVEQFADYGDPHWAARMDISDGERMRAQEVGATLTRRFIVQSGDLTRDITPKDRLRYDGKDYEIFGVKETGNRFRLEITAGARVDQ